MQSIVFSATRTSMRYSFLVALFLLWPAQTAPPTNAPHFTEWTSSGALQQSTSHSTVLFFNESLLSIGGCLALDCSAMSAQVTLLTPSTPTSATAQSHEAWDHSAVTASSDFPPLSYSIAGHHAAVSISGLVYVVRACSIYWENATGNSTASPSPPPSPTQTLRGGASFLEAYAPTVQHVSQMQTSMRGATADALAQYGMVSEYDPVSGTINDTFFSIPSQFVRANASCVNIANMIYIVGGFNISSGEGMLTIDAIDVMALEYVFNVTELDVALSNPSITTDYSSLFIAGGTPIPQPQPPSRYGEAPVLYNRVWRFIPVIGEDGGSSCVEELPLLPRDLFAPAEDEEIRTVHSLSIVPFAGYVMVLNSLGSRAAYLSLHFTLFATWTVVDFNISTPANATSNATADDSSSSSSSVPSDHVLPGFVSGASTGFLGLTVSNHKNVSVHNSSSSHLVLYRIGGVEKVRRWLTHNISIVAPSLSANITASMAKTVFLLPVNNLQHRVIHTAIFEFGMTGGDASSLATCAKPMKKTPCRVRLSSRLDCFGNAAGTFDAPWDGVHDVVFTPTGASDPVYVCFSFGFSVNDSCSGIEVPPTFYNTDVLQPLDIVNTPSTPVPATPAPTAAPTHPSSSNLAMLLYIFGGVAVVTTLVAVLLVSKLRKVPDEGLIGGKHPVVGYGTHQEERYKILGKIGEGAFSVVYLVARRADGVKFAMKHMECQSDLQRQEAIKECEIIRSLQGHPNVINLFDMFMNYEFDAGEPPAGNGGGKGASEREEEPLLGAAPVAKQKLSRHLCLVMEYHPAGDLRRWALNHRGPISEAILASVAFQVCSVLRHIHHKQDPPVIHRDLKPENILIVSDEDGNSAATAGAEAYHSSRTVFLPIVITDFGLARIQENQFCASGAGTLPYVAPECFKKRYTTQCDMWSLGCVLYAVATKRCSHDTVRLMFQDCERSDFKSGIVEELRSVGLSEEFCTFAVLLIEPDMRRRLTAEQAIKAFRKKGQEVYLSKRYMALLSAPKADRAAAALLADEADVSRGGSPVGDALAPSATNTRESAVVIDSESSLNDNDRTAPS